MVLVEDSGKQQKGGGGGGGLGKTIKMWLWRLWWWFSWCKSNEIRPPIKVNSVPTILLII